MEAFVELNGIVGNTGLRSIVMEAHWNVRGIVGN